MKSSLPILLGLAILLAGWPARAQPLPAGDDGDLPLTPLPSRANRLPARDPQSQASSQTLLSRVIDGLDAHQSISAKIRQQVDLFGHQLVGSGSYEQQGRGANRVLRLELKIQVAEQLSSLQQVCDGKSLWIHQNMLGKASLSRIDLARVRAAGNGRAASASARASTAWLSIGGLPKLIQALDSSFRFTAPEESRLDRLPVWKIEGQWTPRMLAELLPDQKEKILAGDPADLSKLPPQVPDRVIVMVGRDDLFPYRIEYHRRATADPKDTSAVADDKSLVVMELFEVQFDTPIDTQEFTYQPGDLEVADQTQSFLKSLGFDDAPAGGSASPR